MKKKRKDEKMERIAKRVNRTRTIKMRTIIKMFFDNSVGDVFDHQINQSVTVKTVFLIFSFCKSIEEGSVYSNQQLTPQKTTIKVINFP